MTRLVPSVRGYPSAARYTASLVARARRNGRQENHVWRLVVVVRDVQVPALLEEREIGAALELPRTLGLDVRLRQDVVGIQPGPATLRRADGRAPATVTEVGGAQRR